MKNRNKKMKYSAYSAIMMIGLVLILLLFNYAVSTLDERVDLSVDMTSQRLYSISNATKDALAVLDEDIFIFTTETAGIEDGNVKELLGNYSSQSDKIHIVNIDIVKNPAAIQYYNDFSDYEVVAGNIIVTNSPDTNDSSQRYRILSYNDLYVYNEESEAYEEFSAEDAITRAIKYVDSSLTHKVWVIDNHSYNTSSYDQIKSILENENYSVESLNILNGQNPIETGDIVVLLSLESDLSTVERDILNDFADNGGKMIIGIDAQTNETWDLSNVLSLIERYNVKMGQGVVFETDLKNIAVSSDSEYMYSFIIPEYYEHEITNDFIVGNYKLLLGADAGYLEMPEKNNNTDIVITPLLGTSDSSFAEPWSAYMDNTPNEDAKYGEFITMAAIAESTTNAKIIVTSVPNMFLQAESLGYGVYKNEDFLLKSVLWLTDSQDANFYISSKPLEDAPLMISTMRQAYTIIALVCVVIPILIFSAGIFIFIRRNNL